MADTGASPEKHRQTVATQDFTFTSHGNAIIFGQSPNAHASVKTANRTSTIRHVSAEPQFAAQPAPATGSKKRKLQFENDQVIETEMELQLSDKENSNEKEEERPAKRKKPNSSAQPVSKSATRIPTLGVKPKKTTQEGKPKTISKARLNALAQPKRRG